MSFGKVTTGALLVALLGCYRIASAHYVEADPVGLQGGVNPYIYVGNNPMSYVDPLGLTAEDVNIIDEYITLNFHDIDRRGGYAYGTPDGGANASTDPSSGITTLPAYIRCKKLSLDEFATLFDTIFHESMHSTDSPQQAAWDSIWGNKHLTRNHIAIGNRVQYETGLGHRSIPKGPMWGTPTNFIPDAVGLYNMSRDDANKVPCDCH